MSNIGGKIDALHHLREQKRLLEERLKGIGEEMDRAELELIAEMDKAGLVRSTGNTATVSITSSIRPNVENWDEFYRYINRNKYYHLLERRPSVAGCRELFETKGVIPGVVPFTQRRLNMRST